MKILHNKSREVQESILRNEYVREALSKLKKHHQESYEHSLRVGILSIDLGIENKINSGHLVVLGYAAHLHDIGKNDVSLNILDKAGALDTSEMKEIKKHPRLGFERIDSVGMEDVKRIVVRHHEYQNSPYPRNRDKEDDYLNALGEVVAVADMFDALTSKRSYKEGLLKEKVEEIMRSDFTGNKELITQVLERF